MLNIGQTHALLRLLDSPSEGLPKSLTRDGTTGLADGHQARVSPIQSAVVLQLAHQSGVHHHDEVQGKGSGPFRHAVDTRPCPDAASRPGGKALFQSTVAYRLSGCGVLPSGCDW